MNTLIAVGGLCDVAFARPGATTHTHWRMTVSGPYSADDEHPSNDDPNMGPTGGFIPPYILKKIRKNRKETTDDCETDDGTTDSEVLASDGGAGGEGDSDQEGSDAPTP